MSKIAIAAGCVVVIAAGWIYWRRALSSTAQQPGEVFIRVGDYSEPHLPAQNYAGHYLPYALLAVWAYDDAGTDRSKGRLNALKQRLAQVGGETLARSMDHWERDWEILEQADGPLPCPQGEGKCGGRALVGLGYKVFVHPLRNEIVIAFRGTDFEQADDWFSNLRWITRFLPFYDQYEQVQRHIGPILDRALQGRTDASVVATGHSLGGGLAQQAAYMDARIRAVQAFDPSAVTGYYDADVNGKRNAKDLLIDRVFQRGEVLAYLRFFMTQLYPVSASNPQIRTVRFSFGAKGNMVDKHSMDDLAAGLLREAGSPDAWAGQSRPLPNAPGKARGQSWVSRILDWAHGK